MNKELELARSIITSALTPNNKTGMTARELDAEIQALMGDSLDLPAGCPSLEALIQRYFGDEFTGTRHNGEIVYRLIPKEDTDYLLKLVARQDDKGSKPMYVAEQAREAAKRGRGGSRPSRGSRGGRGGRGATAASKVFGKAPASSLMRRLGPPVNNFPPRMAPPPTPVTYTNAPSRLDFTPSGTKPNTFDFSAVQKVIGQTQNVQRPASAMPQVTPVKTNVENWGSKFNFLFERYKAVKSTKLSLELVSRNLSSKDIGHVSEFPETIELLYSSLSSMVSQFESKVASANVKILPPSMFPPVGRKIPGLIRNLESFNRFDVEIDLPNGTAAICPCTIHGATAVNMGQAVQAAKDAISGNDNKVEIMVKAIKGAIVEVDVLHLTNGSSLISHLVKKGFLFAKPSVPVERPQSAIPSLLSTNLPATMSSSRVLFSKTAIEPKGEYFEGRISAVMNAAVIAINIESSMDKLIEIENCLQKSVSKSSFSEIRMEDIQKDQCFIVRPDQYCRARVTSVDSLNNIVTLRLIDHGADVMISSTSELFHVPSTPSIISDTPPLAFYVDIETLRHHIFQKDSCTSVVQNELLGKRFQFKIMDRSAKRPQVEIFPLGGSTDSVSKLLKERILGKLRPSLPIGKDIAAVVRFIDWDNSETDVRIHIQVEGFGLEVLAAIEHELYTFHAPSNCPPKPHELSIVNEYSAPYEGAIYRCVLVSTELDSKNRVSVLFFDYGNVEKVEISNLRMLEDRYSSQALQSQAKAVRLSGLPPPGKRWVFNANELVFRNLDPSCQCVVNVVSDDGSGVVDAIIRPTSSQESYNSKFVHMTELFTNISEAVHEPALVPSESGSSLTQKSQLNVLVFSNPVWQLPMFNPDKSYDETYNIFQACALNFTPPNKLGCQLTPNDDFNDMITEMNEFYIQPQNQIPPPSNLQPGHVIVVQDDSCFCRAQVQSLGRSMCQVAYIDYACKEVNVAKSQIFMLEGRYATMPPVGFELTLVNAPTVNTNPNMMKAFSKKISEETPYIKVSLAGQFVQSEVCDCIIDVQGTAAIFDNDVDVGDHLTNLVQH